jgi:hypothetical protein
MLVIFPTQTFLGNKKLVEGPIPMLSHFMFIVRSGGAWSIINATTRTGYLLIKLIISSSIYLKQTLFAL